MSNIYIIQQIRLDHSCSAIWNEIQPDPYFYVLIYE